MPELVPRRLVPRRRLLTTVATALPLLATAGCRSSGLFTGPDPLAGPPSPTPGTVTLEAAIAAESALISRYKAAMQGSAESGSGSAGSGSGSGSAGSPHGGLLSVLLAEHEQHLTQLRSWLVVPAGSSATPSAGSPTPSAGSPTPSAGSPTPSASPTLTLGELQAAEQQSAASYLDRLSDAEPGLAQLFASIAASEATHAAALAGAGTGSR